MSSYISLKNNGTGEYTEKRSRFIGYASPVKTEEEAVRFVKMIKQKHSDARHNVYAYILRENNTQRFSDDGEPHGTAGAPILDLLRKPGITDAAIVVTRYFGGILLGTGGLVRAYTTAAKAAIDNAETATYTLHSYLSVTSGYSDYQKIAFYLDKSLIRHGEPIFGENVTVTAYVTPDSLEKVSSDIRNMTGGKAALEVTGSGYEA